MLDFEEYFWMQKWLEEAEEYNYELLNSEPEEK